MPTKDECKKILSKIGFKLGVSPGLISTKLLSYDDKQDMMSGDLSIETLEANIVAWLEGGMPDCNKNNSDPIGCG